MALSQAAKKVDEAMGGLHAPTESTPTSHTSNYAKDVETFADTSEPMKALTWEGKNSVKITDGYKPKVVDENDVVLKVTGTTVCGSDMRVLFSLIKQINEASHRQDIPAIDLLHGAIIELEKGDILGHEAMGVVDSVGPGITKLKKGDRVVASFNIGCGFCWSCKQKLSSICSKTNTSSLQNAMYGNRTCGMLGYSHFTGGFAGGQAEYIRIPYGDANLLKIPESVADEDALFLSDILATSYHQVVDSGVKKDDVVGIWGVGAIGICAAKWSFIKGASRVIAIDNVKWRLDHLKQKVPQVEIINYNEVKDIPKKINEMTRPGTHPSDTNSSRPPGLDVALECAAGEYAKGLLHKAEIALGLETDTSEIVNEMIASVRPFGTCGLTGVYAAFCNHFNIGAVMEKGVRFIGNGQAPVHLRWEECLKYIVDGQMVPTELFVTHRIPLEDVPKCYYAMDKKEQGIIKPFVETRFSNPPSAKGPKLTRL